MSSKSKLSSVPPSLHPLRQLKINIAKESLRQASKSFDLSCRSFQLSLIMTAISGTIGFIGVGLLLSGNASEGTVTTAGGLVSSVCFLQISKDSQGRLEKANTRLDKIRIELIEEEVDAFYFPYLEPIASISSKLNAVQKSETKSDLPHSSAQCNSQYRKSD
ncbi:MAG: hypothetical protein AAFN93_21810 [Bacteroidota bacterium]